MYSSVDIYIYTRPCIHWRDLVLSETNDAGIESWTHSRSKHKPAYQIAESIFPSLSMKIGNWDSSAGVDRASPATLQPATFAAFKSVRDIRDIYQAT
jgi:hypothetical protein